VETIRTFVAAPSPRIWLQAARLASNTVSIIHDLAFILFITCPC
jgi:hypothetical protein